MRRTLAAIILACAASQALAETVYKWVDAEGVVHFSATPPPGQKTEAEDLRFQKDPPAPAQRPASKPAVTEAPKPVARAPDPAERARNCRTAREIISRLQAAPATSYRREDGSFQRYTPEEIAARIAEARAREREYCD